MGIPVLGPDLSFFKDLEAQQAARTEEVMALWSDERERWLTLSLGERLQNQWGWKTPYFIPADRTVVVLGGPDGWTYMEMDMADAFREFEEQLGQTLKAGFWQSAVDWDDRNGCFREPVRKILAELKPTSGSNANHVETSEVERRCAENQAARPEHENGIGTGQWQQVHDHSFHG